jgi:hypothetical protein
VDSNPVVGHSLRVVIWPSQNPRRDHQPEICAPRCAEKSQSCVDAAEHNRRDGDAAAWPRLPRRVTHRSGSGWRWGISRWRRPLVGFPRAHCSMFFLGRCRGRTPSAANVDSSGCIALGGLKIRRFADRNQADSATVPHSMPYRHRAASSDQSTKAMSMVREARLITLHVNAFSAGFN